MSVTTLGYHTTNNRLPFFFELEGIMQGSWAAKHIKEEEGVIQRNAFESQGLSLYHIVSCEAFF
jgi:hypothetical protein